MKAQDIRRIINAYSRKTSGHPFEDYGNDIKITVNDDCIIKECLVRTQYEARNKEEQRRPYKGWAVAPRRIFNLSDVDSWSFTLSLPSDFIDKKTFFEVDGSAHVEQCSTCSGKGRTTCYTCLGKGKEICPRCGGDYQHLSCSRCDGSGKETCSNCKGTGEVRCEKCHGTGVVYSSESEWVTKWDYNLKRQVGGYEYVTKNRPCSACGGRGTWRCRSCNGQGHLRCTKCGGDGYVTCPDCTQGYLICKTCGGKGDLMCATCAGEGRNEFRYIVNRTLSQETLRKYVCDNRVREFAEQNNLSYTGVDFKVREDALGEELYPQDVRCSSALSKLVSKADTDDGRILFQEAKVQHVDSTYVEYEYDGGSYKGIICNDVFYSEGASPIDEWSAELVDKAERRMKRGSSAATLKMLDQAEMAGGNKSDIADLRAKAQVKLDRIYSAGVSTAFWFYVVLVTPVLFNFYYKLNPVLSWAIVTNNPKWNFYGMVPLVQTLIFLAAITIIRFLFVAKSKDASEKRYPSVWIYFAMGFGCFFLSALAALVILLIINYIGVSVLTTFVVGLIVVIIATVIAFAVLIVRWVIGWFA